MNPWIAKAVIIVANVATIVIRAPRGRRARLVKTVKSRTGPLQTRLLALAWITFLILIVWIDSPVFKFAEYSLQPAPLIAGIVAFAAGLWLFYP